MHIRLEYFDQNENLASLFPLQGRVARRLSDTTGSKDWFLVDLDSSIEFQAEAAEPFQYRLVEVGQLVIRSRWENRKIGEPEPTCVFILVVEKDQAPVSDPFVIEDYMHLAWGMCDQNGE